MHSLYCFTKLISIINALDSRKKGFEKHPCSEECPSMTGGVDFLSRKIMMRLTAFLLKFCHIFSICDW